MANPERQCPHCGLEMQEGARFCAGCGRPLAIGGSDYVDDPAFLQSRVPPQLASRLLQRGNAMLGERKHVTVLFADIRGSTSLIDGLDPEEALGIIAPTMRIMMDAVHQNDGFVCQTRGDGIKALFGAPVAIEDHALRACYAALAMRNRAQALGRANATNIAIRIGLNSGEVVLHSIGSDLAMYYDAAGQTTHVAARLEQIATPGSVLLTETTYQLAKDFIEVRSGGTATIRGVSRAINSFELIGIPIRTQWQARSARGLSALVGRETEMQALKSALARAAASRGSAVLIVGPPGIGKSRLAHELVRAATPEWAVLETECAMQLMNSSYYPLKALLRAHFHIQAGDDSHVIADRVRRSMAKLSAHVQAILSVLDIDDNDQGLKKLDPLEQRRHITEAFNAIFRDWQQSGPHIILVEDLQWADAETKLILAGMLATLKDNRVLLITTQRSGEDAWTSSPSCMRVDLSPLSSEQAGRLLDDLIGDGIGLNPVKRRIQEHAQGNPLFLEELVQTLKDTRVLEGSSGGYRIGITPDRIALPETIHSVLAARIDLLDGARKALLQTAALIGREVHVALLSAVAQMSPDDVGRELQLLESSDFLYKNSPDHSPEYSFKHEITRDVAYHTLLLSRRRTLHAKVVQVLEEGSTSGVREHVDLLADHAYHAELWEKAVPYLLRSGRRAVKRGANRDAVKILERGIEALSRVPFSNVTRTAEIDFRLALIVALEPLGLHRRIADVLGDAARLAESLDDPRRLAAVNCQRAVALWRLGRHDEALAAAETANEIATRIGDQQLMFAALHNIGITHHETGDFAKAVELHRKCIELESPELQAKPVGWAALPSVVLRTFLADSLIELGNIDEAELIAEDGGTRADAADHAYSRAMINHVRGRIRVLQGRPAEAVSLLREAWKTCIDLEMIQQLPIIAARLGEAYLALGDIQASHIIVESPEKLDVPLAENTFGWGYLFLSQSRTLLRMGEHTAALRAAERALGLAEERREPPQRAYAAKLLADIMKPSDHVGAARYLQQAIGLARACGMVALVHKCEKELRDF
jgi:class 3 adenylate cyclase/tetratricopeptide (TPR) repeat protein